MLFYDTKEKDKKTKKNIDIGVRRKMEQNSIGPRPLNSHSINPILRPEKIQMITETKEMKRYQED